MYCLFKGDLISKSNASYSDEAQKRERGRNAG